MSNNLALSNDVASSGTLEALVNTARDYAAQATAENTNKAYAKDWTHFNSWCRRRGANPLPLSGPPNPELVGLYITECASPQDVSPALAASTIERRMSGLSWNYQQRGLTLDRRDRHIATVMAGIKRKHGKPPQQKEAVLAEDILEMIAGLTFGLRDMRDRFRVNLTKAAGL